MVQSVAILRWPQKSCGGQVTCLANQHVQIACWDINGKFNSPGKFMDCRLSLERRENILGQSRVCLF